MNFKTLVNSFFAWYERHYRLAAGITAGLFVLQLIHLYWMTTHVVALKLLGQSYFNPTGIWQAFILIVDYTEIPAILATSLLYIDALRQKWNSKDLLLLLALNSQWLHIFWITDEIVLEQYVHTSLVTLPVWLAWIGIGIDYLELPVIYDTIKKFITSLKAGQPVSHAIKAAKEE